MSKVQHEEEMRTPGRLDREFRRSTNSPSVMWRRGGGVALALVGCTLLASCSGGSSTDVSSADSASTVTTSPEGETSSPAQSSDAAEEYTIPPRPQNLEKPQRERSDDPGTDAMLLATYAMELYPYVLATGELDEWKAISHPDCEFCNAVIDEVEAANEYGGWTDQAITINDQALFEVKDGNVDWRADLLVRRQDIQRFEEVGVTEYPENEYTFVVGILEHSTDIRVRTIDIRASEDFGSEDLGS